jgi:hypothetical protein
LIKRNQRKRKVRNKMEMKMKKIRKLVLKMTKTIAVLSMEW